MGVRVCDPSRSCGTLAAFEVNRGLVAIQLPFVFCFRVWFVLGTGDAAGAMIRAISERRTQAAAACWCDARELRGA